ncbi:MAG: hypothetical protein NVS2B12_24830 [Ktedonobacteraceae bacterium]
MVPGNIAPRQHEHLVHLASWMPFAKASAMLARLLGVQVGKETARRLTEQAGKQIEAAQTQAAETPWAEETAKVDEGISLLMSADGAFVPLVKGAWAEVRTIAIGRVRRSHAGKKRLDPLTEDLSYFSRMCSAERFIELAEVETRRRRVVQAQEVCAVMDGAEWLQGLVDVHRSNAVRILDFPHAAEHLSALLTALEQAGVSLPADALPRFLHHLKHQGPRALLRLAARLSVSLLHIEEVRDHLGYFHKRVAQMDYPHFRQHGWPIGSGSVESANKLVVEARLKGAGMRWAPHNVNAMLALRTSVCNEQWQEMWQTGQGHLEEHLHQRRLLRAKLRREKALALSDSALLTSPALPPALPSFASSPPTLAATLPGSSHPSASHPWKRGRACSPSKSFAKI